MAHHPERTPETHGHPIPEQYVPLIVKAMEQYYAYTLAVKRDDGRYQEAADWFKRKPTAPSAAPRGAKKRKRR